jgi:hypothetical protein
MGTRPCTGRRRAKLAAATEQDSVRVTGRRESGQASLLAGGGNQKRRTDLFLWRQNTSRKEHVSGPHRRTKPGPRGRQNPRRDPVSEPKIRGGKYHAAVKLDLTGRRRKLGAVDLRDNKKSERQNRTPGERYQICCTEHRSPTENHEGHDRKKMRSCENQESVQEKPDLTAKRR